MTDVLQFAIRYGLDELEEYGDGAYPVMVTGLGLNVPDMRYPDRLYFRILRQDSQYSLWFERQEPLEDTIRQLLKEELDARA